MLDLPSVLSLLAIVVSFATVYLQFIKSEEANIILLNQGLNRSVPLQYESLPNIMKVEFPKYESEHPNYSRIQLLFANTGDRNGYIRIISVTNENTEEMPIKSSFYDYALIKSNDIALHSVMLRNIPIIETETTIVVVVKFEWGGISRGRKKSQKTTEYRCPILLSPQAKLQ